MFIEVYTTGPYSTNAYVLACESTKEAVVVDPAPHSAEKILQCLLNHQFKCNKILLTHSHWDHIADVTTLKAELPNVKVYIHPLDVPNLENPGVDGLPILVPVPKTKPDILIEDGMILPFGDSSIKVIHTPGHSPGSVCFYCEKEKMLFTGDTLFKGTIGNLSFPTRQPDMMWPSLAKLDKLPPETTVYTGHGPTTTIGEEYWLPHAKEIFS